MKVLKLLGLALAPVLAVFVYGGIVQINAMGLDFYLHGVPFMPVTKYDFFLDVAIVQQTRLMASLVLGVAISLAVLTFNSAAKSP